MDKNKCDLRRHIARGIHLCERRAVVGEQKGDYQKVTFW